MTDRQKQLVKRLVSLNKDISYFTFQKKQSKRLNNEYINESYDELITLSYDSVDTVEQELGLY